MNIGCMVFAYDMNSSTATDTTPMRSKSYRLRHGAQDVFFGDRSVPCSNSSKRPNPGSGYGPDVKGGNNRDPTDEGTNLRDRGLPKMG